MPINILMPALSPTMEKGNLAKWLKKEGDAVKSGDVIAEIETDKATMEVEAVDDGTLARILVPEGTQDVAVNDIIAVLAGEGEDVKAAGASAKASPAPARAQPVAAKEAAPAAKAAEPAPQPAAAPKPAAAAAAPQQVNGQTRIFSSPLARRLAKDAGIELGRISGSGPHGRVVARDVESAKSGKGLKPAAAPAAAPAPPAGPSEQQVRATFAEGSYDVVPHDNMRKIIAQRLTLSKQTIPHFYLTADVEIGRLLKLREDANAAAPKDKDGNPAFKLSVNDLVIKAWAAALVRVPAANAVWAEDRILRFVHADIGVAVALEGGLITPLIRQAETKSLSMISNEMKTLAARAREKKLKPDEYQGGASAISNLGMYGVREFSAIINPPQSTILAVGAGARRPVETLDGGVEFVSQMTVTLSCDHRVVDGALGAKLLASLKGFLEQPLTALV
jgi:pyruvate dehydrogenase E2 component (dihydrolipoamide acetyltransferase)